MAELVFFGLIGTAAAILAAVLNSRHTANEYQSRPRPLATVSWNG